MKKISTKKAPAKAAPQAKASVVKKSATKKQAPAPFVSTGFWLLKSEPESYSIDQLAKDKKTLWTGVRNYQARNFMMTSMKSGDHFLFYHSNAENETGVVGTGTIAKPNQPDISALDSKSDYYDAKASTDHPIWFCAEVAYGTTFKRIVTLGEIRETKDLEAMPLLQKGQRLSIQPVHKLEFDLIVKMGKSAK